MEHIGENVYTSALVNFGQNSPSRFLSYREDKLDQSGARSAHKYAQNVSTEFEIEVEQLPLLNSQ
jgi:hypothetical protein